MQGVEKSIEVSLTQLFEIGDRRNLQFARMVRGLLEKKARRNGQARRLLIAERMPNTVADIEMKFSDNSIARSQDMEEQICDAEVEHYVKEDRSFFERLRKNIPKENIVEASWTDFSVQLLAQVRQIVSDQNVPVATCLMSANYWSKVICDPVITSILDPVTRHEMILNGFLGDMLGMSLQSDAYRHPRHKFLEAGEMFFFAAPEHLGEMLVTELHENEAFDTGLLIETDNDAGEVVWKLPHDFHFEKIDYTKVSLLRMK